MTTNSLGLDVSPLRIGWGIVSCEDDDYSLIDHGVILFKEKQWVTPGMRADEVECIADNHPTIHKIGIEAVFVGPNKLGSIRAAYAVGQLEAICEAAWPDADQKILTATQWRSLCGIKQGGKEPVMEWSVACCHDNGLAAPANQDAADAIAIAWATAVRADG
jgi:Holliday junction resolvasome RuvABC endonuclease subunit